MKRIAWALVLGLIVWGLSSHPVAQLLNKEAPVIVGHYHLNVTSVDAHKKFWVDTLGGTMGTAISMIAALVAAA